MYVVLQKQADLLAAEVLADAPEVGDCAESDFMSDLYNIVEIREPEVEVEFGYRENDCVAAVRKHFLEIGTGVFLVVETVIAYGCVLD